MEKTLSLIVNKLDVDTGCQVVKFVGEFDKAGHSGVKEELDTVVEDFAGKVLVFDFSGLQFINSEGIGYLMEIHTHLVKEDKKLVIVSVNSHVADVFETIGISQVVEVFADLDAFLNR